MTTTTSSPHNIPSQQTGFLDRLRSLLRQLFGGQPQNVAGDPASPSVDSNESEADVILAPGGFRIQRPRPADAGGVNISTFDELLPEVREGLSLLPPLPTVVLELLKEIQSSSSTASSVADIAASDPTLAASLLRAVNSAAFGLSQKVTSVSQAVSLLGFSAVRSLVVRFRLEAMMPQRSPETAAASEDIWTHSLAVSYIAATLASRVTDVDRGFVSTLGLLHDIGRLAICSRHPDFAAALRNAGAKDDSVLQREAIAFGADHATIGAILGNRWQLPADLNTAIRWHHAPERAFEPTDPPALKTAAYLVQLADQLAKFCFAYSDDMEIDLPPDGAMEMLGLSGSLPQLLDAKVRANATQAILYADENSTRPITLIRPFLKLRRAEEAAELCARLEQKTDPRVTEGTAGADLIDASEKIITFDSAAKSPAIPAGTAAARYSAPASAAGADWLIKSLASHWQSADVPARLAACARAGVRALLPNLLASLSSINIAWQWEAPTLHIAVRSDAMAFATRLPAGSDAALGRRVLEAELANILNLGWFDVETSTDGATLLLRSR